MIKKVFIANRGEIVSRIMRTCEKAGIETAVVYSEADKEAEYISRATESYFIGDSAPVKSYLNIEKLIDALKKSGADAVHPGYGFLSESAAFAKAVAEVGAKWIGPDPIVLENIESKCYCRIVADEEGIPVTPGTVGAINGVDDIYKMAEKIGLPLLLKLDKGGGGKGIEKIEYLESPSVTQAIFDSIHRIGQMAFASGDVYIEKEVLRPRHIEIQFLADSFGNIVCVGERECSIQRRYQKIIEEAPSVAVSEEARKMLYKYTSDFVKKINYSGAGTIEYLLTPEGNYYLMEINARLQVEHPVSEMVTGIDLVEWQIRIANGEKLAFIQEDVKLKGHAIECRIYAEDPKTFMPAPGTITDLKFPDMPPNILRVEHALRVGHKVSPFYDPMVCKLVVWGEDRAACIANVKKALKQFTVKGISTNITTALAIMRNKNFVAGEFATDFLKKEKVNIGLENYAVTVSRQFGSLGRPVAKRIAEILGIDYYDRDILEEMAKRVGLPIPEMISEHVDSEYDKMRYPLGTGTEEEKEKIFEAQSNIILELAEKGSGIFVGRCADYVLRNNTNHFSVFIYAPYEARKENCIKVLHLSPDEADQMINEVDEARQSYSTGYAKVYSENLEYKDILIDGSLFGSVDEMADVLVSMIRRKFNLA